MTILTDARNIFAPPEHFNCNLRMKWNSSAHPLITKIRPLAPIMVVLRNSNDKKSKNPDILVCRECAELKEDRRQFVTFFSKFLYLTQKLLNFWRPELGFILKNKSFTI